MGNRIIALAGNALTAIGIKHRRITVSYVPGTYIKEFDGWRGLGILFVVLAHYFPRYLIGSWVFMEMFFVMSGFLITGILLDSKGQKNYFKGFILRRVLRVFPLYYLTLIILFFLLPNSWLDLSYHKAHQLWFWLYVENWLFAIDGWPAVKALSHFWSLSIEEQFYIMWPFVVLLFSPKGLIRFCIVLFVFSIFFRNVGEQLGFVPPFQYVATFARMEGIVLGAIIAVLVRTNKSFIEKYTVTITMIAGLLAVAVFVYAGTMHMEYSLIYRINYTLVDIFFAGMITMTLCRNELILFKQMLNWNIFKQLGIMSYCIYILHQPILIIVQNRFLDYFNSFLANENFSKLACVGVAFIVTIPVVYIIHKKIEMPMWKLKKYV
ncbi:MAG: acyltransferase [Chitinophagaceae bacterium]|nr:acyltransferase [Chitinophagaceae bacterium]MCW5928536.1 acyltransferase [Chitinophagaceae bacterium]